MYKFHYIAEFLELSNTLNFSKTADHCYITQPALSRHIAALEKDVGAQLLKRDTHSVVLTPAGEVMRAAFQEMMKIYHSAQESAKNLSLGKTGVLKISIPIYWMEEFAEPVSQAFLQSRPQCDVLLIACQPWDGMEEMLSGKSDLFVNFKVDGIDEDINEVPYAREKLSVVCVKGHPLASKDAVSLEEVRPYDIFSFHYDLYSLQTDEYVDFYNPMLLKLLEEHGIYPKSFRYTSQVETLGLSLKECPSAIGIVPYSLRHMNRSYLSFIPIIDDDCSLQMCLYYRADNENNLIPQYVETALQMYNPPSENE
ncbi:MAG: LysR family transcriptional regulator [Coriobacteriales bacterium]|jgi:DNA-binding transcriptional LysR family regulator